ncbi:glycoside hydrolase family 18 [Pedobacter sp. PLR]|uniref:glycoside hydrolase family 18 n=1 Tax=Pedobacter sp. PLR TaxID=2994465 RepID=UPI002246C981|nr:glycoside hydrolase family 18 [Pedobacter sp. PLR]MCX2451287.1 glycoside hydrolase family 18 [Pedobacter sp. PLR]
MNKLLIIAGMLVISISFFSCSKENMPENIPMKQVLQRSDDYYANLRAYKKTDHQVFFGWFGATGGEGNPNVPGVMDQIPDSVDIVSLWGGAPPVGSYNHNVMKKTQELKGTRFVLVRGADHVSTALLKKYPTLPILVALDSIARDLDAEVKVFGADGFDIDYEPHFGQGGIFTTGKDGITGANLTTALYKSLSKYLGPLSGTGKLLIIDGESTPELAPYIDYLVQQAYAATSPTNLQNRFVQYGFGTLPIRKFIVAENFESYWEKGGVNFTDPVRGVIPSLLGMAYWQPTQGRKGGTGVYLAQYEYPLNPDFKFTRQAIQIMNPAVR